MGSIIQQTIFHYINSWKYHIALQVQWLLKGSNFNFAISLVLSLLLFSWKQYLQPRSATRKLRMYTRLCSDNFVNVSSFPKKFYSSNLGLWWWIFQAFKTKVGFFSSIFEFWIELLVQHLVPKVALPIKQPTLIIRLFQKFVKLPFALKLCYLIAALKALLLLLLSEIFRRYRYSQNRWDSFCKAVICASHQYSVLKKKQIISIIRRPQLKQRFMSVHWRLTIKQINLLIILQSSGSSRK